MDADWDLHAVVRGCCSAVSSSYATTTTTATASPQPLDTHTHQNTTFNEENVISYFPDLCQPRSDNSIEQFLNNIYHPLQFSNLHKPPCSPQSVPVSPLSVIGGLQDPPYNEKQFMGKQQTFGISRCTTTHAQGTVKFKKRKNQNKRVCQVPVDGSSPDLWSWRKYGQKPIKGSPYPRGYYKCSTSKGCSARKQVERNKSDSGMLILTYTGEHNHPVPTHRNSLAGSSRSKPTTSGDDKPPPSSPISPANEIDTDDDILYGLDNEQLVGPTTGDIFSDHHAPLNTSTCFPWLSNNVATTTTAVAGGH